MSNYVTHLECSYSQKKYVKNKVYNLSDLSKPLLVRYDFKKISSDYSYSDFVNRHADCPGFWKYLPLLPINSSKSIIDLGELITPLIKINVSKFSKHSEVFVKDEGRLPTGSFKARGLALAVAKAKEFGIQKMAIPTNGNAGAALAAYASKANIESIVLCPEDTPTININEAALQGANTIIVNGLINECGKIIGDLKDKMGWFDVSTLKEPYRIEGKKTMGLELFEQFNQNLPDAIFYPTGGGTGLIGMWKAFQELRELGWLNCKLPKMFAVQSETCAPIVKAFENNQRHAELWENASTIASGIRVPAAIGDFLILDAIRESEGSAIAVSEESIIDCRDAIANETGLLMCPEGAATAAGYIKALSKNLINENDQVVLFNCASGLKYPMPKITKKIDKNNLLNKDFS